MLLIAHLCCLITGNISCGLREHLRHWSKVHQMFCSVQLISFHSWRKASLLIFLACVSLASCFFYFAFFFSLHVILMSSAVWSVILLVYLLFCWSICYSAGPSVILLVHLLLSSSEVPWQCPQRNEARRHNLEKLLPAFSIVLLINSKNSK